MIPVTAVVNSSLTWKQQVLPFTIDSDQSLSRFFPGHNAEALAAARLTSAMQGEWLLFLWGHAGTGKSHLLQGACEWAFAQGFRAIYVPLKTLAAYRHDVLDNLEEHDLVCLDDLDSILPSPEWEVAIFNLFNRIHSNHHHLMVTASALPSQLNFFLPDLRSRIGWGLALKMQAPDDTTLTSILQQRGIELGLELSPAVIRYLLTHCPREPRYLLDLLQQLDQASLSAQRDISVPFIKSFLES